jgi:hypothetical protein
MIGMSENSAPLWLKVMAVVSAIALAAGYVVFRKDNADQARRNYEQNAKTDTADSPDPEDTPETIGFEEDRPIMSGSKSSILVPQKKPTEEQVRRAVMSSSKSGLIIPLEDVSEKEDEAEEAPPRVLLPSSKSIDRILRVPPATEEP